MFNNIDPQTTTIYLVIVLLSISCHEFGHAKSADAAGDPTPRSQGRVTLNPIAHFDPMGFIMIVILCISGYGLGWGKPVMVSPNKMRNPRWDHFMSVLWGPLTNFVLALVFAILFRIVAKSYPVGSAAFEFCLIGVIVNVGLGLFNLIPLGPLDGHWLIGALLPPRVGAKFTHWSRTQGTMLLILIIVFDQFIGQSSGFSIIGTLIREPAVFLTGALTGLK